MQDSKSGFLLLTPQEAEKAGVQPVEQMRKGEKESMLLLNELRPFIPDAILLHRIEKYNDKLSYHSTEIRFQRYGVDFKFFKFNRHLSIYPLFNDLPYTNNDSLVKAKRGLESPCLMGVLSKKKMEDWIIYWVQVYNAVKEENEKNRQTIETFREELAKEPDVVWNGSNAGRIRRNGLEFSFKISLTSIERRLTLSCSEYGATLADFRALADNKYKPKEKA